MFQKALQRQNRFNTILLGNSFARRSVASVPGKNYFVPEGGDSSSSVQDMVQHLDKKRPVHTLLYFTASWNPVCAKIERDYEALTTQYPEFHHIRVDTDATPKLKFYFDARVEPQFLWLINGGEVHRQIGYNFGSIGQMCEKVQRLHATNEFGYYGNSGDQWERFYDAFDKWSRVGEYDRDAWRAKYDSNADTHRGPGNE